MINIASGALDTTDGILKSYMSQSSRSVNPLDILFTIIGGVDNEEMRKAEKLANKKFNQILNKYQKYEKDPQKYFEYLEKKLNFVAVFNHFTIYILILIYIHMRFIQTFESYRRTDRLSGILLYVEGHILLVHAKKHKDTSDMWSLPKGHIESSPLKSALKELKEETGIKLDKNHDGEFTIRYNKSGVRKVLTIFIYERKLSDLSKFISDSLELKKKVLKKVDDEIYDVKLFPLVDTLYFLEPGQRQIINHLIHY